MLQPKTDQISVEVTPPRRGGWVKGVSGNPAGRAKHVLPDGRSVREAARDATPQALTLLLEVMKDTKAALPLRIACAQAVLRTGHADAAPEDRADMPAVLYVEKLVASSGAPVRGVLASPVQSHVWREDVHEVQS